MTSTPGAGALPPSALQPYANARLCLFEVDRPESRNPVPIRRHVIDCFLEQSGIVSGYNDTALTGLGVTESAQSIHANLIYSPFPKLDVGAELIYGQRSLEDDREGDLRRLHTTVKYSF